MSYLENVNLRNILGEQINPATEDTLASLSSAFVNRDLRKELDGHGYAPTFPSSVTLVKNFKKVTKFLPNTDNPTTIYIGTAIAGTSEAVAGWTIRKFVFVYDASGEITSITETQTVRDAAIMNDYLTETYL